MLLHIAIPRPLPAALPPFSLISCVYGSNKWPINSSLMPTPVSATSRCRIDDFSFICFCEAKIVTLPPDLVNLFALDKRLLSIFRSDISSPITSGLVTASEFIVSFMPFVLIVALNTE